MIGRRHRQGRAGTRRIITRSFLLACLLASTLGLVACTTARLAYNQAPNLSYWWLDSHFDFDHAQSELVRGEIEGFFAWHRREELPRYADLLRRWQAMAPRDLTADQACAQAERVRERLLDGSERTIQAFARLATQLTPAQLQHLQQRQARSEREFERDFLRGSPEQRLQRRLDTTVERYERFYGNLSDKQRQLLRDGLARSPWDAQATQAERQRRQADLVQTLRDAQAQPAQAPALLRAYAQRWQASPTPGYAAQNEAVLRHGCAQFAALHNSTSAAQREHALRQLQGYQDDLIHLSAKR